MKKYRARLHTVGNVPIYRVQYGKRIVNSFVNPATTEAVVETLNAELKRFMVAANPESISTLDRWYEDQLLMDAAQE